jgi:hypothetical protein
MITTCLRISLQQTLRIKWSQNITKVQVLTMPHYNMGYIEVMLHKSILLCSPSQTNQKVTHRSTIPLITILRQPSCRPKHHCPQVKPIGSIASSLTHLVEVPLLEVVAVEPQRPAELLYVRLPPLSTAASWRCSVTVSTSRCRQHPRPPKV